jgi:TetR/AcrR family transcriptional regulator, cholesterol catabolism regulator
MGQIDPGMTHRQRSSTRKGDQRREDALTAATELFSQQGYEQTSIQEVAAAAGLLKGSLYYYFASKEDVLYQVLLRHHQKLYEFVVVQGEYSELPSLEALRIFVERHITFVLRHPNLSALYAQEQRLLTESDGWRRTVNSLRRRHEEALLGLLDKAVAYGEARAEDPILTVRAILSMANATHRWYLSPPQRSRSAIAKHHATLAVRSVQKTDL